MEYNKTECFKFLAEPFEVDYTGRLTLSVLGNHLLNCAGIHAEQRGFGISTLNDHNCTWVLSRLVIEMERMPLQYSHFSIETWVEAVNKLFTSRNFAIADESGSPMGYVRSIWAMINIDTRKPADLLEMQGSGSISNYVLPEKECPVAGPSRLRVKAANAAMSLPVRYSDIDINGHVNSVRYIEHILDLFPLEKFKESRLWRFEIAYANESHYGDTLEYYIDDNGNSQYSVEVKKKDSGEVVCRSLIIFTLPSAKV